MRENGFNRFCKANIHSRDCCGAWCVDIAVNRCGSLAHVLIIGKFITIQFRGAVGCLDTESINYAVPVFILCINCIERGIFCKICPLCDKLGFIFLVIICCQDRKTFFQRPCNKDRTWFCHFICLGENHFILWNIIVFINRNGSFSAIQIIGDMIGLGFHGFCT